jgi:hypothetical protein
MNLAYLPEGVQLILWGFFQNPFSLLSCTVRRSLEMWAPRVLLTLVQFATLTVSAPSGFPTSGNGLWYTTPGNVWSREWLPVGNGYLAGKPPEDPTFLHIMICI